MSQETAHTTIRAATLEDGGAIWRLVKDSQVLDVNSSYAYLLWCKHFGHTSVVAEMAGRPVGFVTGFRPPESPEVIFVWQVAVDSSARGQGLAGRLLRALVELPGCEGVTHMETTVTPSNAPSRALFRSFGRAMDAEVQVLPYFTEEMFPDGGHEPEELFRIGPFQTSH
jgi:L-2,4-diaminobutyric acid acetyltransferase